MPKSRHIRNPRGVKRTAPQIYPRKPCFHSDLKPICKANGLSVSKKHGEYRINWAYGPEATAYYTSDLQDAIETAYHFTFAKPYG